MVSQRTRRQFVRATGTIALGSTTILAGCSSKGTSNGGEGSGEPKSFGGWLEGVSNYDGVTDKTGKDSVTVEVGVKANDGYYGFGPAAVRVSPGTTVKWKWTGKGSQHNVVDKGGAFKSDLHADAGVHFEHAFDSSGTYKYYCSPHKTLGMKGIVSVE